MPRSQINKFGKPDGGDDRSGGGHCGDVVSEGQTAAVGLPVVADCHGVPMTGEGEAKNAT
jgi:hypothetical protein